MHWTDRDRDLLGTLLTKVRVLSLRQVAATWWPASTHAEATARRRLRALSESQLLAMQPVLAHPLPPLRAPLVQWRPGQARPRFGPVAWKLQSRWKSPLMRTTICFATQHAVLRLSGRNRLLLNRLQVTHDLGLTQVYLHIRKSDPQRAARWTGEDSIKPERGRKVPDAVIRATAGQAHETAIEFGGAYDKRRLEAFHRHCRRAGLPYEIW